MTAVQRLRELLAEAGVTDAEIIARANARDGVGRRTQSPLRVTCCPMWTVVAIVELLNEKRKESTK